MNQICPVSRKMLDFAKSTDTRAEFRKSQEAIRIPVINEICKFPPHLDPFDQKTICINSPETT